MGPSPAMLAERGAARSSPSGCADWIDEKRALAGRMPRRYPSIEDAFARMQAENKHLTPEQARYLTVHGASQNEDGTYSWKFDNYVRSGLAGRPDARGAARAVGEHHLPDPARERQGKLGLQPGEDGRMSHFKDARVVDFEDAGHWVHHDRLDAFVEEVRNFLWRRLLLGIAFCLTMHGARLAAEPAPPLVPTQGDFIIRDFHFRAGGTAPELRIHYRTLGTPTRDGAGRVTNAVLILQGTGGSGAQFLAPQFAGVLFGPGQLLDVSRWYIILPDDIGHGQSSKPSDGLRQRFPHYGYRDMVEAEHALVTEGLRVDHLRLVMGTSMGCMHAFLWGEKWPAAMDALMPLACLPVQIAGRNRLWRDMIVHAIRTDPTFDGGDYKAEPAAGLQTAPTSSRSPAARRPRCRRRCPPPRRPTPLSTAILPRATAESGRQRSHLSGRIIARLRSFRRPRGDHRAGHVDQLGRRFHQSARVANRRARGGAVEERPLRPAADQRSHARPWHPHLGRGVEELSCRTPRVRGSHAARKRARRRKSARIWWAALWPGAPVTPPPGWVPEPHM